MRNTARYHITFGLSGCYLPDSIYGPVECSTRAELADVIRDALKMYEMPASLFKECKLRDKLWPFIKKYGSSCASFDLDHKGVSLSFHGLTEDEYIRRLEEEPFV